jgi:hypothetical protein
MFSLKKLNKTILKTIENSGLTTKIQIFFSKRTVGEEFDPYEANYNYTNQNPLTIKGYVVEVDSTKLVYKQMGLSELGMVEVTCDSKYSNWFKLCNKIEIDGKIYHTYREATGNRCMITQIPVGLIKVVLGKNE